MCLKRAMVVYSCTKRKPKLGSGGGHTPVIPAFWEAEAGRFLSLVYRVSFRTARAIQRNPVSKNPKSKQTNKQTKKKKTKTNFYKLRNYG